MTDDLSSLDNMIQDADESLHLDDALMGVDDFDPEDLSEWLHDEYQEDTDISITPDLFNEFRHCVGTENYVANKDDYPVPYFPSNELSTPFNSGTDKKSISSRGSSRTKSKSKRRSKSKTKRRSSKSKNKSKSKRTAHTSGDATTTPKRSTLTAETTQTMPNTTQYVPATSVVQATAHIDKSNSTSKNPAYNHQYNDALNKLASSMRRTEMSRAEILRQRKRLSPSSADDSSTLSNANKVARLSTPSNSDFNNTNQQRSLTMDHAVPMVTQLPNPYVPQSTLISRGFHGNIQNLSHQLPGNTMTPSTLQSSLAYTGCLGVDRLTNLLGSPRTMGLNQSHMQYMNRMNNLF